MNHEALKHYVSETFLKHPETFTADRRRRPRQQQQHNSWKFMEIHYLTQAKQKRRNMSYYILPPNISKHMPKNTDIILRGHSPLKPNEQRCLANAEHCPCLWRFGPSYDHLGQPGMPRSVAALGYIAPLAVRMVFEGLFEGIPKQPVNTLWAVLVVSFLTCSLCCIHLVSWWKGSCRHSSSKER